MSTQEGKYNVKAVSNMLGIQPGTLRAWERRYQIIAPPRNEAGHRLYTEQQVQILKWLVDKVNQGFTISQAISLLEQRPSEAHIQAEDHVTTLRERLLQALLSFEEWTAHELLNEAFSLYTVEKVALDILSPLLVRIGDLWGNGKITSAHEHFASAFLRSRLGMAFSMIPVNRLLPKTISVCGPNEWHELGLLIFTLYLRRRGYETIYLGASIQQQDLSIIIQEVKPSYVFLSCTLQQNVRATLQLIDELKQTYPHIRIGIGGRALDEMDEEMKNKYRDHLLGQSKEQWDEWLKSNEKYLSKGEKTM
ncbi:MerR family transcriptional regulator [Anoxybacillus flavithermus]|uniref:MerR family transcriptional regulator n=1 Tax=Anoxybacillus flavithermus TaxID=33934 RepID=A0A2G5RQ58_9BACL|nr:MULTISPECIES: B12-binding domain-containing protein [Anoxybacillus]KFZ43888.1 MerR family transcriptional regulator [Anoxybacillus sp. KU2-6(11)]PIC04846.1 MerR family transcriptional regulator [Anoxybacillus flavithermus]